MRELIDKLQKESTLHKDELLTLLRDYTLEDRMYLHAQARSASNRIYGNQIFVRGLIEFTNFCRNDCYYCGIRKSNRKAERYRLSKSDILACCKQGYDLGFRTFVLQGGEDTSFAREKLTDIVHSIHTAYPDCAITLSVGEKSHEEYLELYQVGAERYLLRHETANAEHYSRIHPLPLNSQNRKRCLTYLKKIGFQVGTGFMVGSPYQTLENLTEDLLFIKEFEPQMVGIGPFLPHQDTPFSHFSPGRLDITLMLISIIRLMLPNALIPSTTALGTIHDEGREKGILAGANVIMPNLSPIGVRKKYLLYDNKICTGEEAAESILSLQNQLKKIGYEIIVDRGDYRGEEQNP